MLCAERPPAVKVEETLVVERGFDSMGCLLGSALSLAGVTLLRLKPSAVQVEEVPVYLVLCESCRQGRSRLGTWTPVLGVLAWLSCWFLVVPLLLGLGEHPVTLLLAVVTIVSAPLVGLTVYKLLGRPFRVRLHSIDDHFIYLDVPNETYPRTYDTYLRETGAEPDQMLEQDVIQTSPRH